MNSRQIKKINNFANFLLRLVEESEKPNPNDYYSISIAARSMSVNPERLRRAILDGEVPAPSHRTTPTIPRYHKDELPAIKKLLGKGKRQIPSGFFTFTSAAKTLKIPRVTLRSWLDKELIPKAKIPCCGIMVYDKKDLEEIAKVIISRAGEKRGRK